MRDQRTAFRITVLICLLALVGAACGSDSPQAADPATDAGNAGAGAETPADGPAENDAPSAPDNDAPSAPDLDIPDDVTPSELYAALAELPREERDAYLQDCAREEGEVVWYAAQNVESLEAWADDFMELHPEINVSFSRGKSPDTTDKVLSEARADRHDVDIIQVGGVHLTYLREEGLVADHYGLPAPEGFPENAVGDWWMSLATNPNLITYNTNLVSEDEAPQGYEDLLDPKWKGKVAIDVSPQNLIIALVREWGEERTREYLQQLVHENDALVRKGHTNMTNLLAAGEFPIAIELYSYKVAELIDQGAPLAWVAPDPTPSNTTGQGIAEHAPHPCAAVVFSNYLLSERGGDVYAQFGRLHNNPNVEPLYPSIAGLVDDPNISPNVPENMTEELSLIHI